MTQDTDVLHFTVLDARAFPMVRSRSDAVRPGYAAQWVREMDLLLARGEPFVILFEEGHTPEEHEDRKTRGLWLKKNKDRLAGLCKALVRVEPDPERRAAQAAQAAMAARAFGVPTEIVGSPKEAADCARAILKPIQARRE